MTSQSWPVHGRITGPIVMIGFGSIGKGTLPLIERHFDYDKSRLVIIDPEADDRPLADKHGVRFINQAVTKENYRELLTPLLTAGGGQGFCVNLSVDTGSVDIMSLCRELGALYVDTVVEPWLGFYFDKNLGTGRALQLCAAREPARGQAQEPGRPDRRVHLRRQPRHGVVVRQAGDAQPRRRSEAEREGADDPRRVGASGAKDRRQGHPHRRARHAALEEAQADEHFRQHMVGRGFRLRGPAAG